jgi:hypothetical protein
MSYFEQRNADPKPFVLTASASNTFEKVVRAKHALASAQ